MLLLLACLAYSDSDIKLPLLFDGNWSVEINSEPFSAQFVQSPIDPNVLLLTVNSTVYRLEMVGNSEFILKNGERTIGLFDFSKVLAPHLSASGKLWDGSLYSAQIVSYYKMVLTVYRTDGSDFIVFTREVPLEPWYDKYYKIIFSGVVFVLCWLLTRLMQRMAQKKEE